MRFLNRLEGPKGHEYCRVLGLEFKNWSIRFHWWKGSDDNRAYHDHPYPFSTLVLWGGYDDLTPPMVGTDKTIVNLGEYKQHLVSRDRLRFLSFRYRKAEHLHTVQLTSKRCLTLVITGKRQRRWGFTPIGTHKKITRDKYFAENGHHAFNNLGDPVRVRPDGSLI